MELGGQSWPGMILSCAAAAALSLDRALIGQWMMSRPIIAGPLLGYCLGDVQTGWWIGILFEAIDLDSDPVGGINPMNGSLGTAAVLIASLGRPALPLAAAFPLGLAIGFGHRGLEELLRKSRDLWTGRFREALNSGKGIPWAAGIGESLLSYAGATTVYLLLCCTAGSAAAVVVLEGLPPFFTAALEDALSFAPLIGASSLIVRLWRCV